MKHPAVICDIDGVLADNTPRLHYIKDKDNPDWEGFYNAALEDQPYEQWCNILRAFNKVGNVTIILLTNRSNQHRWHTETWLRNHNIPYDTLFMRPQELPYDKMLHKMTTLTALVNTHNIILAIDDHPQEYEMFKEAGVPAIYVDSGYYQASDVPDPT